MQNKNWFDDKKCNMCGQKGEMFRYFDSKHQYILCKREECDLKTRIITGFFEIINIQSPDNIKGV